MNFEIRYLARLRDELGVGQETYTPEKACDSVEELITLLSQRGAVWQSLLNDPSVMIAVNKAMTNRQAIIATGDEIAFLPPVTGG